MASYGPKFRVEGSSPDGHDYRADIEQEGYSSSVTRFTPAVDGIDLRWDLQTREDLTEPWMVGRGSIKVKEEDPSPLAEIFDGDLFEYRVSVYQDGNLYFRGFADTGLYEDSLWEFLSDPRIAFTDGLGVLSDIAFKEAGSEEKVSEALMRALSLLPTDLQAEINMEWYCDGVSVHPVELLYVPDEAWTEGECGDSPSPNPTRKSGRAALRSLLRRFGMRMMQSGGKWRMRQRLSLLDDSLEVGTYDTSGSRVSEGTKTGRERDLTAFNATEESRSFQSEYTASTAKYRFKCPLKQVLPNPSFEDSLSEWSTTGDAQRVEIDTVSERQKTTTDQYAVKMTTGDASVQMSEAFRVPADASLEMILRWADIRDQSTGKVAVHANGSGHGLHTDLVTIDSPSLPGEDATLHLTQGVGDMSGSVEGTPMMPAGAKLRIFTDDPSVSPEGNEITLTEPLRVGDETVTGNLQQEIKSTGDQDLKPELRYWSWTGQSAEQTKIFDKDYFTQHEVKVYMVSQQGDPVHGPLKIRFGVKDAYSNGYYAVDDVGLEFWRDGETVKSFSTTMVDEAEDGGDREEIEVPIGIGPTDRSGSRIYTSSREQPGGWGRESSGSSTLGELQTEESLRMQRTSPETRRFRLRLREGDKDALPHHVYLDGSTRYEAIAMRRGLLSGKASMELAELKDDGTSGLSASTAYSEEDSAGGGGGSGSSVQILPTGDGAESWQDLTGIPDDLFARGGGADSYPKTAALQEGDITAGLGWTPANETPGTGLTSEPDHKLGVDDTVARTDVDETFTENLTVQKNFSVVGWAAVEDKMSVGASAPYGPNAPGTQQLQVSGMVGADGYDFYNSNSAWNVRSSGGTGELLIHQNFGSNYSVIEARTRDVDVTDESVDSEATLALTRTDTAENDVEFIDLYNNGYWGSDSVQYGLRVQKRGQGQLRPFAFEWSNGADTLAAYDITPPDDLGAGASGSAFDIYIPTTIENTLGVKQDLTADSRVQHPQHTDKRTNWAVTPAGSADFRRIYTDELVAKTFTVDLTQALAGSDYLTKSVATLSSAFTVPFGDRDQFDTDLSKWSTNADASIAIVNEKMEVTQETGQADGLATFYRSVPSARVTITLELSAGSDGTGDPSEQGFDLGGTYCRRKGSDFEIDSSTAANQPAWSPEWRFEIYADGTADWYAGGSLIESGFSVFGNHQNVAAASEGASGTTFYVDDFQVSEHGTITVDDLPGQKNVRAFSADDWIRLRVVDNSSGGLIIMDVWGQVEGYVDNSDNTQDWTFKCRDDGGQDGTDIGKEAPALDYGQSGQGLIRRTVEGPNAPYTAIETWTGDPVKDSNYTTQVLEGNLNGFYDYSNDIHGFAAGDYENNWIAADPNSGFRIMDGATAMAQLSGAILTLGANDDLKFDGSSSSIEGDINMNGKIYTGGYELTSSGLRLDQGFAQTINDGTGTITYGKDGSSIYWSQDASSVTDAPINATFWEGTSEENWGLGDFQGGRLYGDKFLQFEHGEYTDSRGIIFFGAVTSTPSNVLNISMTELPRSASDAEVPGAYPRLWVDSNGYLRCTDGNGNPPSDPTT
jgi:hypothetical protein